MPLFERLTSNTSLIRFVAVLALFALVIGGARAAAQEADPVPLTEAQQATVFLIQTYEEGGRQIQSCIGSGTLVSADGLILTNAHLARSGGPCQGDQIIVALPVRLDEPPVPTYTAEIDQIDERLDLAVLRITAGLDGSLVDPDSLNLPAVDVGNSADMVPGTTMTMVGYPGTGATSVTTVEGAVTHLTREKSGRGSGAWFRTDAEIPGGMAGGGAYNAAGELIGIPTSMTASDGSAPNETCLAIQDNDGDGLITERDACVPIGAPVTAIRPVQFGMPLIDAAELGISLSRRAGFPQGEPLDAPIIERVFFSTGVSDAGIPSRVVSSLPSGASSVYLFFDYANMSFGLPFELAVTRDGSRDERLSLGPLAWGGGETGTWYIGADGLNLPDGTYQFDISVNGAVTASTSIQVGGEPTTQGFSDLTFGVPDENLNYVRTGVLLPSEVPRIDGVFTFSGMPDGQSWTEVWYLDGVEVSRNTRLWDNGPAGQIDVQAVNFEGLPLGHYRLELFIGEALAATGDVTLAGDTNRLFYNTRIHNDITREGQPAGQSGSVMPLGTQELYLFMDWDFIPLGTTWTYRWFLDGRLIASQTRTWNNGTVGTDYWVGLSADEPLPEGAYAVEILMEDTPLFSELVTIGSGTRPGEAPEALAEDVFISGRVVDAFTGDGIPGALVIILDVALESPQFTWNESEIHTQAITDRDGRFEFTRPLTQGNFYTSYVFAEDYITILEDNFTIPFDQPSPVDIVIEMNRP